MTGTCPLPIPSLQQLRGVDIDRVFVGMQQADIWSIGIILYIILFGNYPFNSKDPDYPRRVVNAQYTLPDNIDVRAQLSICA